MATLRYAISPVVGDGLTLETARRPALFDRATGSIREIADLGDRRVVEFESATLDENDVEITQAAAFDLRDG